MTQTKMGPPQNPQILWGEEEGMERAQSSLELAEAGTEQSGISSDEEAMLSAFTDAVTELGEGGAKAG